MTKPNVSGIITGAAGGIAHATLKALSDRYDGQLHLLDIDADGLADTCKRFERDGLRLRSHTVDLCDGAQIEDAIASAVSEADRLDFLFANAGIMTAPGPFEDTSSAAIDRSIALNFGAVVKCTQAAWTALSQSNGCVIVNASGAGLHPLTSDVVYSASKAAVIMFARANAMRTNETGIRFNAVCPGVVDTPILNDTRTGEWREEVRDFAKAFKLIQPEQIANVVLEFLSDNALNGEVRSISNERRQPV